MSGFDFGADQDQPSVERSRCSLERTASNKIVRKLTVVDGTTDEAVKALVDTQVQGFLYLEEQIKNTGIE